MAFAAAGPGNVVFEHARRYCRSGAMAADAGPVRDFAATEFDPFSVGWIAFSVGWIALAPVGTMARGTRLVLGGRSYRIHGMVTSGATIALRDMVRKGSVGIHHSFVDLVGKRHRPARAICVEHAERGSRIG